MRLLEESRRGPGATRGVNEEPRYPGRCEARGLADGPGRGLRLRLASGLEPFSDALLGPQLQDPQEQCGALLLRDRTGQWTYHFAVTVDDWRHGIDLVVRGADLLTSTGRQLRLARLLGRPRPPAFLHHPLVYRPDGTKLSKANRDAGVRDLRAAGRTPDDVLGFAAHACGLTTRPPPCAYRTCRCCSTRRKDPDGAGIHGQRARADGRRGHGTGPRRFSR